MDSNSKKWIHTFLAVVCVIFAYVLYVFMEQMTFWFELEAHVAGISGYSQVLSVSLGLITFVLLEKNLNVISYLNDVFTELTKVIWSKNDEAMKLTFGIVIGVTIASVVLGLVDFLIRKLLSLLY